MKSPGTQGRGQVAWLHEYSYLIALDHPDLLEIEIQKVYWPSNRAGNSNCRQTIGIIVANHIML
jgi:hypothetical protein